jgi:anti-sigma regulatory factor (Ser/Thr protein kinase)
MTSSDSESLPELFLDAKIVMSSDARLLAALRSAVGNLTLELGWSESDSRAITLAVDEAMTNKIRHACKGRADARIQIEFRTEPGALVFQLTDHGEPPDPEKLCARQKGSVVPGGLGTHIIRDVMDEVSYVTDDAGNHLILKKQLPHGSSPESLP